MVSRRKRTGTVSGSVVTTLLLGVSLVGGISYMAYQALSGPVGTMARTTTRAIADQQMTAVSKLIIAGIANAGGNATTSVSVVADDGSGQMQLTVDSSASFPTGSVVQVSGLGDLPGATGLWPVINVSGTEITLQGSSYAPGYSGGGVVSGADCDADNYIEPPEYTAATAGAAPLGGGLLPPNMGLPVTDPWGSSYGYCVWDVGTSAAAGCGGAGQRRLAGSPTPEAGQAVSQTVLAVVSAGPDRRFGTTCGAYDGLDPTADLVAATANSDDLVMRYTYAQAASATSTLWRIETTAPSTATTSAAAQNLEVGEVGNYTASTGVVTALNFESSGLISAGGGLQLATDAVVTACDTAGALRYNATFNAVQFCNGAVWTSVGTGGGGGSGDPLQGQTDINGIDWLADGIAEYSSLNIVGLGRGALCLFGKTADGATGRPADQGGCTTAAGTGLRNTMTGESAGAATTSGSDNTGFGYRALLANTTGSRNTAFGYQALVANTVGDDNTAAGSSALAAAADITTMDNNILLVGSSTGIAAEGDMMTVSVPLPAGTQTGDLIIFAANCDTNNGMNFPAGFTVLHEGALTNNGQYYGAAWKIADGTEGANITAQADAYSWGIGAIVAVYRGVDPATPIDASSNTVSNTGNAAPWPASSSVTTATAGAQLVLISSPDSGGGELPLTLTPPAGFTLLESETSNGWSPIFLAAGTGGAAGPTGTLPATISSPSGGLAATSAILIALRPAGSPVLKAVVANNDTLSVTLPPTVIAGDVILLSGAGYTGDCGGCVITWPAGYTELTRTNLVCSDNRVQAVAWKLADGSEAGQTLTPTGPNYASIIAAVYSGVAAVDSINASHATVQDTCADLPASFPASVTTTVAGTRNVWFARVASNGGAGSKVFTPPPGYVKKAELDTYYNPQAMADGVQGTVGPSGTLTGSLTGDIERVSLSTALIALTPAEAVSTTVTAATGNTAAGVQALNSLLGGQYNTAAGYQALMSNPSGNYNAAAGYQALRTNVGSYNTAAGYEALELYTGAGGTAAGYRALALATGAANTAAGYQALDVTTTGARNTALGSDALGTNTTGSDNTAVGVNAHAANTVTTTAKNVAVGYSALYRNRGNGVTGLGHNALSASTTAWGLTAAGRSAMRYVTDYSPNKSTALGFEALGARATPHYGQVAGGYRALLALGTEPYNSGTQYNTALGWGALANADNPSGDRNYNTAAGYNAAAGIGNTGNWGRNVSIGYQTVSYAMTNPYFYNTVTLGAQAGAVIRPPNWIGFNLIGYKAGALITTLNSTVAAIGSGALSGSTLAGDGYMSAFGFQALRGAAAGAYENVAFGHNALAGTTAQGGYYVERAFGSGALARGSADGYNGIGLAFGAGAGQNATPWGYQTVAFGYQTLQSLNNTAAYTNNTNLAFGWLAQQASTTGIQNIAFGAGALSAGSPDHSNVAFGAGALAASSGARNTAIGAGALSLATTADDNTATGAWALAFATGGENTAFGALVLGMTTTGTRNAAFGSFAAVLNMTGSNNVAVGTGTGPIADNLSNTVCLGAGATVSASNAVQVGNAAVTMIGGEAGWSALSDRRFKKDIAPADLGLEFIMKLRPVSYRLIGGNGRLDYGFIAQEVEDALGARETNMVTRAKDERGTYSLRHADIIVPLARAVQEQEESLTARARDIAAMKAEILSLQKGLESSRGQAR